MECQLVNECSVSVIQKLLLETEHKMPNSQRLIGTGQRFKQRKNNTFVLDEKIVHWCFLRMQRHNDCC